MQPDPIRTNIEVAECGHKLALAKPPKNNCLDCWQAYFKLNPSVVTGSNTIIRVFGYKQLVASKGTKFVKMFQRCIPATNESAAA